jgi:hypothetical protein
VAAEVEHHLVTEQAVQVVLVAVEEVRVTRLS